MKYENTKTGVVIEVNSEITGGNWKPVSGSPAKNNKASEEDKKPVKKESKKK